MRKKKQECNKFEMQKKELKESVTGKERKREQKKGYQNNITKIISASNRTDDLL